MVHQILFIIFAVICVAAAVNLLLQRHPINSALSLVVVMASLALIYLLLGAEFVAAIQVIVYAGAIMVLFVFVIMLLNAGAEERSAGSKIALVVGVPGALVLGTSGWLDHDQQQSSRWARSASALPTLAQRTSSPACCSAISCCLLKSPPC